LGSRPQDGATSRAIIGRLHHSPRRRGDGNEMRIMCVGRAFDAIPKWQESVKSLDERWMSVEKVRHALDDAWGVDSADKNGSECKYGIPLEIGFK
jgi:hypothetical protein